mgnify:FL=1|tara:strand:+ start:23674 stop:24957 length:1284 start_codon:yes stop_codon:yes gene_type:complete
MNLFSEAKKVIAGGVNSPARSFSGVGGEPLFFKSAKGAYIRTEDGRELIDYVGSWGPMILGHSFPPVLNSIKKAIENGLSFGAPTTIETKLAKKVRDFIPSMEKLRMVSTGTEATMSAIRLARGYTGRDLIVKFEGCYHGHVDSLLIKAGSGALTHGTPSSPGIPESLAKKTLVIPFNDRDALKKIYESYGDQIACTIVEPITGNMNMIKPIPGFLEDLQEISKRHGSLLIFDEVMTGFRVAKGGAQSIYNIEPDITALGKILGGGLPAAAFGGKNKIMSHLSPEGPVYQAGTLSGNPIAMNAGYITLKHIEKPSFFDELHLQSEKLMLEMKNIASKNNIPFEVVYEGGMFGFSFTKNGPIKNYNDIANSEISLFKEFFHLMLEENIYFAPSPFEAGFMSSEHSEREIDSTLSAVEKVFKKIAKRST